MPPRNAPASVAGALGRKRRLHPLAIVMPFGSSSGTANRGRGLRLPSGAGLLLILLVFFIISRFTDAVTVTENGDVFITRTELSWVDALILIAATGALIAMVVRWWTFRWWVEDGAIWTSGGIFNRWRRCVPIERIVMIDRSSSLVRRLFGVSRIGIETATVDRAAPDILLGCLSNKDAIRLENLLVATLVFDGATDPRHQFDTLDIDRLSWLDLLLAGATTLQITRAGVMLYAAIQVFERFTEKSLVDEYGRFTQQHTGRYDWVAEPVGIIVALWLASTFYFVVSFSRFQLGKHEGWLLQETGVIRLSRRLIRADAIQGLEVFRSPLQRRFRGKRAMLRMRMPAYGSPSIYAMVLHPAVTDAALPRLTQEIASMDPATCAALCGKRLHRLSTGSRGVYILQWPIRIVACCAGSLALLLIVQPDLWWLALAPLPLAAPLAWAGLLAWRSAGWYADNGDWLVIQRGAFGLSSTATRVDRIQFIRWSQPLLSRRVSTISMAISVATSGGASMVSRILALLRRPANPAIVRIRAMGADDARGVAIASGYERSLPAELAAD